MIDIGGKIFSVGEAISKFGVCSAPSTMFDRTSDIYHRMYELGWSGERAVLTPDETFKETIKKHFGLHVMFDAYGASEEKLTVVSLLYQFLRDFPAAIGMTRIAGPDVFKYDEGVEPLDAGVTGTVIIAESLISVHSFPKRDGFVTVDVYSCKCFSPYDVVARCKEYFETNQYDVQVIPRGPRFSRNQPRVEVT